MSGAFTLEDVIDLLLTTEDGMHAIMYIVVGILGFLLLFVLLHKVHELEEGIGQDADIQLHEQMRRRLGDYRKALGMFAVGSTISFLGGIGCIWFLLLDHQYLVISEQVDALIRGTTALIGGVLILVSGYLYKTGYFKKGDMKDGYIDGIVVGTHREIVNRLDITQGSINLTP